MNFILQKRITNTCFPTKVTETRIGNDVWIGDNVMILAGVKIGSGAVIGAGSIVTRPVEDYEVHAGVPAKFIRYRISKELIEEMLKISWWDWDDEKMERNSVFFSSPVSANSINEVQS